MGWQATGWAFKSPIENAGCKFVLVALAERAGNEDDESRSWRCYPSIDTISKYTAQGYRTIQRHLDWLEENGFIARERRTLGKGKLGAFNFTLNPHGVENGQWPKTTDEVVEIGHTEPVKGTGQDIVLREPEPFEAWWAVYPRKIAKVAARKAWGQMTAPIAALTLAELMVRTRLFAEAMVNKDPEHVPHGATWLRGERWNDELSPHRSQTDGQPAGRTGPIDRAAERAERVVGPMLAGAQEALDRGGRRRWRL